MTHPYNDHSTAGHYIQTGHPWHVPIGGGFNATPNDWPAMGSVVEYLDQQPAGSGRAPRDIAQLRRTCRTAWATCRSTRSSSTGPASMPAGWAAATTRWRPTSASATRTDNPYFRDCTDEELNFRIQGLAAADGADARPARPPAVAARRSSTTQLRGRRRRPAIAALRQLPQRALSLVTSDEDAHGPRHPPGAGGAPRPLRPPPVRPVDADGPPAGRSRRAVRHRRLGTPSTATAGTRTCTATTCRSTCCPVSTRRCPRCWTICDERGLLDETLVVCLGEMGRTPQANDAGAAATGARCFPAVLAGGGIRGGDCYGRSDKDAAYPLEQPTSPRRPGRHDLTTAWASIRTALPDRQGRPITIVEGGRPCGAVRLNRSQSG